MIRPVATISTTPVAAARLTSPLCQVSHMSSEMTRLLGEYSISAIVVSRSACSATNTQPAMIDGSSSGSTM